MYSKDHLSDLLDSFREFNGKRGEEKNNVDRKVMDYINEYFTRIESDSFARMVQSDYRYVVHEMVLPKMRGNLSVYSEKKVHIIFFAKNRNGRQAAYIREV